MKTKRFKIIFETYWYDQKTGNKKVVGTWKRIIVAEDLDWAKKIAKAMTDEETVSELYLGDPILIEETGEDPEMNSFDSSESWAQAIDNMGFGDGDFEMIPDPNDPDEMVGIKKK